MGVLIKIDGVIFNEDYVVDKVDVPLEPEEVLSITDYPVRDTLKGLYDLGGTVDDTLTNHAPLPHANSQDESLQGDYVMADNYVEFSGAANRCRMNIYLQPDFTKTYTLIGLFSVPEAQAGMPNYRPIIGARLADKTGISLTSAGALVGIGGVETAVPQNGAIISNNFAILAMIVNAEGCNVYRYTNGRLEGWGSHSGTIDAPSTAKFLIGGNSTSNKYSSAKISLAAIHEGDITGGVEGVTVEDKLLEICQFVKAYGKQKGLIIE